MTLRERQAASVMTVMKELMIHDRYFAWRSVSIECL